MNEMLTESLLCTCGVLFIELHVQSFEVFNVVRTFFSPKRLEVNFKAINNHVPLL